MFGQVCGITETPSARHVKVLHTATKIKYNSAYPSLIGTANHPDMQKIR
jgi:hypothetical protein